MVDRLWSIQFFLCSANAFVDMFVEISLFIAAPMALWTCVVAKGSVEIRNVEHVAFRFQS